MKAKLADIVYQNNVLSYIEVRHGNFTIKDDEKEPGVIKRMMKSEDKLPSISKIFEYMSNLHKICIIPIVLSYF